MDRRRSDWRQTILQLSPCRESLQKLVKVKATDVSAAFFIPINALLTLFNSQTRDHETRLRQHRHSLHSCLHIGYNRQIMYYPMSIIIYFLLISIPFIRLVPFICIERIIIIIVMTGTQRKLIFSIIKIINILRIY